MQKIRFNPLTDEQIEALRKKLTAGEYEFEIQSVELKEDEKTHAFTAVVILKVFDEEGKTYTVYDYLNFRDRWMWKLKHFYESLEMESHYSFGEFNCAPLVGQKGILKIKMVKTDQYGEQPKVADYIKANKAKLDKKKPSTDEFKNDLPF